MSTSIGVGDLLKLNKKCPPTWWRDKLAIVTEIWQEAGTTSFRGKTSFLVKMVVSTDAGLKELTFPLAYINKCKVVEK